MKKFLLFIYLILKLQFSFSQVNSAKSLIDETMLHPGDSFTGYVYKKGEWAYNQALTPYPSWFWWGITNRITTELDIEAWLGGVPSFNFRISILKQNKFIPSLAYETMYQYLNNEIDLLENYKNISIKRKGNSWYNRINASWRCTKKLHFHFSTGMTFSEKLIIENRDSLCYKGTNYNNLLSPDFSSSIDWRVNNWMSFHSTLSYGSTFLYLDNVPKKQQFATGIRMAPFINNKYGFLRCFRFEVAFLSIYFKDANQWLNGPICFLFWQWNWKKKKSVK